MIIGQQILWTPFALAIFVRWIHGWQRQRASGEPVSGKELQMAIITTLAAILIVPLFLSAVLFVSIVWTHRPDLSMVGILRECVKEIKNRKSR